MENYNEEERLVLLQTQVSMADVKQEAELRKLEGTESISLRLIYSELANKDRVLYYGIYHREIEEAKTPWEDPSKIGQRELESLINWTLDQAEEVQGLIFNFLEKSAEEKESGLISLIDQLESLSVIEKVSKEEIPKKITKRHMTQIMLDSLPTTKEDLIIMYQRLSPETKRPAASVRQFIREYTRKNLIFLGNDGNYHKVTVEQSDTLEDMVLQS